MGAGSAMSMAQMPVAVPTLTRLGWSTGAAENRSPLSITMKWWAMSSPSFCRSSFEPKYSVVLEF